MRTKHLIRPLSFHSQTQQTSATGGDYNVVIAATAPTSDGGLVHAVTVIQLVQTWTVIRAHNDFVAMQQSLTSYYDGIPPCPQIGNIGTNVEALVSARNQLQHWLLGVLMLSGVRDSSAVVSFLTDAANIIPSQYDNVPWTLFAANGQVAAPPAMPAPAYSETSPTPAPLDDMAMEDMFEAGEEGAVTQHDETDEEDEYRPSLRYQPTYEPVSAEDEMDMALMAEEVEMIEDVGSLAQSLGASHLGRSLMLQEEMAGGHTFQNYGNNQHQHGLQMGMAVSGMSRGGIGSAMENATPGLGGSFNQTKPESPPRLDAFKMIKVIGKGSFGGFAKTIVVPLILGVI